MDERLSSTRPCPSSSVRATTSSHRRLLSPLETNGIGQASAHGSKSTARGTEWSILMARAQAGESDAYCPASGPMRQNWGFR
jgi:hypothetical protein